jgi:hypothetical protein
MVGIQTHFETKILPALFAKVSAHVGCAVDEARVFAPAPVPPFGGDGGHFRFHLVKQTSHSNKSFSVSQIRFTYTTHEMKLQTIHFILTLATAQILLAQLAYHSL